MKHAVLSTDAPTKFVLTDGSKTLKGKTVQGISMAYFYGANSKLLKRRYGARKVNEVVTVCRNILKVKAEWSNGADWRGQVYA